MDEELIFGIGYDFEKGLKEAEKEAEAATARLERILSRRPVGVSVSTLGVETFADKTGKTIKELQEQLDKLSAKWRDMPLDRMWTGDGAMRQLSDEARELWDELYTVTTVLHSMGRDAQTMANESIREIEKEEAALKKLTAQQEAARRKAEERRQAAHDRVARSGLQREWNAAADAHAASGRENNLLWGQAETVKEITEKVNALQGKLASLVPGTGLYEALTGEFVKWSARLREVREEAERYIATARGFADVSRTIEVTRETMGGLSARLAEYRQSMESMEVGSDEWNKTAVCIRQVSTALEAATQWAKDFSAAAFKGLGEKMTTSRVEELQLLRQELEQVEEKWNRLRASNEGMGNGDGGERAREEEMNSLMERRIELQNEINVRLRSMADAQADYEKAQAAVAEKAAADDARLQALTLEETSIENITRKLEAWRQEMNGSAIGGREWEEAAKEVWRLSEALDEARRQGEALKVVNTNVLSGLTEQLGRLEGLMGRTDTGSDEWKRMAAAAAMLRDNIAQIQEHMSDFGQASWKGLEPEAVQAKTAALQSLREQIREVDEAFNRQMQGDVPVDDDAAAERAERVNSLLEERLRLQNEINKLTETAGQAAARLEKAQAAAAEQARREAERERIALYGEEQTIDGLTKKLAAWQEKLNGASIGGHAFNDAVEQVRRLSEALEKAKRRVEILTGKARGVRGARPAVRELGEEVENVGRQAERAEGRLGRMGTAIRNGMRGLASNLQTVNAAWDRQHGLVERIIRRMAVYASMSAMGRFLQSVREVTAEFELQRVSLGAIIRDQEQADSLFKEIKAFALKSPLKIMDLTRYTKQVAAYGIETEKLFDTTKRLADVSVGLGVDMGRIVLAYGQVKAASYLRAAEVRQFTEAGIPMLELLAKKLTGMNGELVTTADVMDMISKRGVGFEMVEKIFEDLTSKGGMFYNMQEKQGNTLYGMWSKLGDAASMMYDEIGNTSAVNGAMKDLIGLLSTLMQHWRGVAGAMATGGLLWGVKGLHSMGGKLKDAAGKQYEAAVTARIEAEARLEAAQITRNEAEIVAANRALETAKANETAAASENRRAQSSSKMGVAFRSMWKSILAGVGITAVIGLVAGLVGWLTEAIAASGKLKKELDGIDDETRGTIEKATYNFKRLADAATEAATGSKKQRDALEELQRTYGNIIGPEELQIDRLKRMKDEGYGPLVQMIKEYNWAIAQKKKLDAVTDHYTKDIVDAERDIREVLGSGNIIKMNDDGAVKIKFNEEEITKFISKIEELANTTELSAEEIRKKAFKEVLDVERYSYGGADQWTSDLFRVDIDDVIEKTRQMNAELRGIETSMREQTGKYGEWGKALAAVGDEVDKATMKNSKGEAVSADSALGKRIQNNRRIRLYTRNIKAAFEEVGIAWKEEWAKVENLAGDNAPLTSRMDFSALVNAVEENREALGNNYEQLRNTVTAYQGEYENIVPSNKTVQAMRKAWRDITSTDEWLRTHKDMSVWDMAADESWEDYSKRIRDSRKQWETDLQEWRTANSVNAGSYSEEDIKEAERIVRALKEMERYLKQTGGGRSADGRAGILQEMAQGLEQIYEQYEKLKQSHGAEEALKKAQEMYRSTLWEMEERNKKYDFGFGEWEIPTSAEELWQDLQEIQDVMARLPKGERPSLELQVKIDKMKSEALVKAMAKRLKELGERVARTKEAREFYNKLVGETGDVDMARVVTDRIYGSWGETLFDDTVSEIKALAGEGIDLTGAIDTVNARIDYRELELIYLEHKERIVEANRATLEKIIADGKKATAEEVAGWEGALAKAKSFESRRTAVILRESEERAKMLRNAALSDEQRRELMDASRKRENKELAEIDVEEFKSSDDYVRVFENLDKVSKETLGRMKERLRELMEQVKESAPGMVKQLQQALNKIEEEESERGFGNRMTGAVKKWVEAQRKKREAEARLRTAEENKDTHADAVTAAQNELTDALWAQEQVEHDLKSTEEERLQAALRVNSAEKGVKLALEDQAKAAKEVEDAEEGVSEASDEVQEAVKEFCEDMNKAAATARELASFLGDVKDLLGVSEDSAAGIAFDSAVTGLQTMAKTLTTVTAAIELMNIISKSNPWVAAAAALMAVTVALGSFLTGNKVRKANREIERQQEALDALTHSYERLEAAEERAFGSERIASYRKRVENLRAQEAAYRKQAEAERSKGKSADKDKVKDYEDSAREAMEEIADMRTELQEYFAGTDLTSAAREFAEAWIDARVQFENTTDAMREKFGDMIKNMVVEAMAAKLMETSLRPFYESIEKAAEDGVVTAAEVAATAKIGLGSIDTMNRSMEVMWAELSKAGLDAGKVWGDAEGTFHGIARDIASASEEDINGLAAGVNVANYYMSRLPGIGADVAAIRGLLAQRDSAGGAGVDMAGLLAIQNEAMAQRRAIEANTALTAQRCGELVGKVEAIATLLGRVVKPNGTSSGWGVIVR